MQQFAVGCGCGRSMTLYGRAGRNAFRCGCGTRVQVVATPVTARICTFGDCRTLATTKDPLRFCADHEEQAATLLAHAAAAVKVRELEAGLTQTRTTWNKKYGDKIRPIQPDMRHVPLVYFARREHLIKIGTTTNIRGRMSSLHAQPLATELGGVARERQLHRRFRHLLASGQSREWFHPGPDLISYINELRAASGAQPVGSPDPATSQHIELKTYLAETTDHYAAQTLTRDGEPLGGRVKMKHVRADRPPPVHVAVTVIWPDLRTAVAACDHSKEIDTEAAGLVSASQVAPVDRCNRTACRARWPPLPD